MRNLAGHPHATLYAAHELGAAGIPAQPCEPYGEPQATVEGVLGRFTFRRAWYYWICEGPMPLAEAQALFDGSEEVRKSVRACGDCTAPRPGEPGATPDYFDDDGRRVVADVEGKIRAFLGDADPPDGWVLVGSEEERDAIARPFIECYHVDTAEGLRILADAIRNLETK